MIRLEHLRKVYSTEEVQTTALDNVSLSIAEGELIAIMGPSGCGKTTLLNTLGLLDSPTAGSYHFLGQEVSTWSEARRTALRKGTIGFVFQNFNLIDELTIEENVEVPLVYLRLPRSERRERVEQVLTDLRIIQRKDHFPQQLSGGQQQRAAVARAIVGGPRLEAGVSRDRRCGEDFGYPRSAELWRASLRRARPLRRSVVFRHVLLSAPPGFRRQRAL